MRIRAIREGTVPVGAAMRNAAIAFDAMTASAVVIETDRGRGYAFDSIGRYGKGGLLRERFIPRVMQADPRAFVDPDGLIDPAACARVAMANEKPGGHGERTGAIGLIEAAAWDLRAKLQGLPLWRSIAEYYRITDAEARIAVYASCGHFRRDDDLRRELEHVRERGYRLVKIKLDGRDVANDAARVEVASSSVPGLQLAVDVNGMLPREIAPAWFAAMHAFDLAWIEEPASPLDYALLNEYCAASATPIATGENLFSFDDARNLLRYGGLRPQRDYLQFDPLLSYGLTEYARILECFGTWQRHRFLPHAGHLFAAQCVAGFKLGMAEAAPDPSLPYGGFWDTVRVDEGRVTIPDLPGVGYEGKANLHSILESI